MENTQKCYIIDVSNTNYFIIQTEPNKLLIITNISENKIKMLPINMLTHYNILKNSNKLQSTIIDIRNEDQNQVKEVFGIKEILYKSFYMSNDYNFIYGDIFHIIGNYFEEFGVELDF